MLPREQVAELRQWASRPELGSRPDIDSVRWFVCPICRAFISSEAGVTAHAEWHIDLQTAVLKRL